MTADATAGRYRFPSVDVDDPARALADLNKTIPLIDDLAELCLRFINVNALVDVDLDDIYTVRAELQNVRRRIEAIHARLST